MFSHCVSITQAYTQERKSCGCDVLDVIATLPEMSEFRLTLKNDCEIEKQLSFNNSSATGSHCEKSIFIIIRLFIFR